jgi:hypothetical protein
VKTVKTKNQPSVDQVTGGKIPKSFVFAKGKIPAQLKQLELDLRKLMLPYTAIKLKVLNVARFDLCQFSCLFHSGSKYMLPLLYSKIACQS